MIRCQFLLVLLGLIAPTLAAQSDLLGFDPFTNAYYIFDRTTGNSTTAGTVNVTGQTVDGVNGAAIHPTTHVIYAIVQLGTGAAPRTLCTFDPATGVATVVGSVANLGDAFSSLAFDSAGVLYGVTGDGATTPETLYTIDLATGAPTFKQTLGNGADGEVIAFNPVDGLLYHSSGNGTIVLETINLTSGAITNIAHSMTGGETFGLIWDPEQNAFLRSNISATLDVVTAAGAQTTGPTLSDFTAGNVDARGILLLPFTSTSTTTLNLGTTNQGTASTPVSFTLEGHHLWGNVTVTGFTGVVVSLTMSGGYGASVSLTPGVDGSVATTTIFARIQASATAGAISGNITVASSGTTTVNIAATGTVNPPAPEMDVLRGATAIADASTDNIGNQAQGPTLSVTYTISNTGAAVLNLSGTPVVVVAAGTNSQNVSVVAQPAATLAATTTVNFTVNYQIIAVGAFDFTISIANDDSNENPYNWTVSGNGMALPEIDVSRSGSIASAGTDAIGNTTIAVARSLTYTISNGGSAVLNVTPPVTISGLTNCTASVTTQPATTVAASATTTVVISVTPTAAGAFSFDVSIVNDDSDENPYNFQVSGTGVAATGGGGGGGGGDDGGGCAAGATGSTWVGLLAILSVLGLATRLRRARG